MSDTDLSSILPCSSHIPNITMSQTMLTLNHTFVSFFWALHKQSFDHSLWGNWPVIICISTYSGLKNRTLSHPLRSFVEFHRKLLSIIFWGYKSTLKNRLRHRKMLTQQKERNKVPGWSVCITYVRTNTPFLKLLTIVPFIEWLCGRHLCLMLYRHYFHLILPTILWGGYYYPYFQVRNTKFIQQIFVERLVCARPCLF